MFNLSSINRKHYIALGLFFLYALVVGIFEFNRGLPLRDDQITTAAMVLKDLDPNLFPNDPVLGGTNYQIYAPPVRWLMGVATRLTGGDVEDGARLLVPFLLMVFLSSMYLLLNEFTDRSLVSFVVSLAAASRRPTFPDTFFGVWGMQSILARSFFLAFLPLVIWLFWRYRHDRRVIWSFLLLGLISNFHPTGGYAMTPILLLTLLLIRGINRKTIIDLAAGGLMAVVGIFPFLFDYMNHPSELLVGSEVLGAVALYPVSAERFTTRGYVLPIPSGILIKTLSNFADLIFLTLMAFLIRWRTKNDEDAFILKLAFSVLVVTIGGTALLQLFGWLRGEPVFYSEIMRGFRFVFIPLFIGVALFLEGLFKVVSIPKLKWFYFAAFSLVVLILPMKNNAAIVLSYHQDRELAENVEIEAALDEVIVLYLDRIGFNILPKGVAANAVTMLTGIESERAAELLADQVKARDDYDEIATWVQENTAVDERVLINRSHFKLKSHRELGEQIIPDVIPEAVSACFENADPACLVAEARNQQAGYIIVVRAFPEITLPIVFENDTYIVYEVKVEV